jgi:hypothetical protein
MPRVWPPSSNSYKYVEPSPVAARVADTGFVLSLLTAIAAHHIDIEFVLRCILDIVLIGSGAAAGWYHWKLARRL